MDRSQTKSSSRRARLASALLGLSVFLSAAAAEAAKKSVAIIVEGANADAVRDKIAAALPTTIEAADAKAFVEQVHKAGFRGALTTTIDKPKQREKLFKAIRQAEGAASVDGALIGKVRKGKSGPEVYLVYVDQVGGDLAVDEVVPLPAGGETDSVKKVIGTTMDQLAPPEKPVEKPADKPTATETPPPTTDEPKEEKPAEPTGRPPHDVASELFEVRLGFEFGGRSFRYNDALPQTPGGPDLLRTYSVAGFATGSIAVGLDLYPAAGSTIPVLKDLGVQFDLAHALALQSAAANADGSPGPSITTHLDKIRVALRERFHLSGPTGPTLGARVGYTSLSFTFSNPPPNLAGSLASVSYGALTLGGDARVPFLERLALVGGLDYLAPLSHGEVYDRFKSPSVGGLDLRGGLSLAIASGFEGRFLFEYDRFWSSFKPAVGDTYVAGGALDSFFSLNFSAAYVY